MGTNIYYFDPHGQDNLAIGTAVGGLYGLASGSIRDWRNPIPEIPAIDYSNVYASADTDPVGNKDITPDDLRNVDRESYWKFRTSISTRDVRLLDRRNDLGFINWSYNQTLAPDQAYAGQFPDLMNVDAQVNSIVYTQNISRPQLGGPSLLYGNSLGPNRYPYFDYPGHLHYRSTGGNYYHMRIQWYIPEISLPPLYQVFR